jgi:hypothetical protein
MCKVVHVLLQHLSTDDAVMTEVRTPALLWCVSVYTGITSRVCIPRTGGCFADPSPPHRSVFPSVWHVDMMHMYESHDAYVPIVLAGERHSPGTPFHLLSSTKFALRPPHPPPPAATTNTTTTATTNHVRLCHGHINALSLPPSVLPPRYVTAMPR